MAALTEAFQIKLKRILADPGRLDFSEMRNLIKVMDLSENVAIRLCRMSGKGPRPGLSDKTAAEIRRKILGITEEREEEWARGEAEWEEERRKR